MPFSPCPMFSISLYVGIWYTYLQMKGHPLAFYSPWPKVIQWPLTFVPRLPTGLGPLSQGYQSLMWRIKKQPANMLPLWLNYNQTGLALDGAKRYMQWLYKKKKKKKRYGTCWQLGTLWGAYKKATGVPLTLQQHRYNTAKHTQYNTQSRYSAQAIQRWKNKPEAMLYACICMSCWYMPGTDKGVNAIPGQSYTTFRWCVCVHPKCTRCCKN